jgi:hypothetical protein
MQKYVHIRIIDAYLPALAHIKYMYTYVCIYIHRVYVYIHTYHTSSICIASSICIHTYAEFKKDVKIRSNHSGEDAIYGLIRT